MNCEKCGRPLPEGAAYCQICGHAGKVPGQEMFPVPEGPVSGAPTPEPGFWADGPVPAAAPDKSRRLPLLIGACVAVMAVLVIALSLVLIPRLQSSRSLYYDSYYYGFMTDNDLLFLNEEQTVIEFEDFGGGVYYANIDGTVLCVLEADQDGVGTLWHVTKNGRSKIADDVAGHVMADNGEAVAYITDYGYYNNLYVYHAKTGKSTKIAEDVVREFLVISSDGKTVAYTTDDSTAYIYAGGEAVRFKDDTSIIAIANNSKYIYYTDEGGLHVSNGKDDRKLISGEYRWDTPLAFNSDLSEVIFPYDNRIYISKEGGDRKRLGGDGEYTFVMPAYLQYRLCFNASGRYLGEYRYYKYGVQSFEGNVYMTPSGEAFEAWYIGKGLETEKLGNVYDSGKIVATRDKRIYYIDEKLRLNSCNLKRGVEEQEILARNVLYLFLAKEGEQLYYVDDNDTLYYHTDAAGSSRQGKTRGLAVEVDTGVFYINEDKALCFIRAGTESVLLEDLIWYPYFYRMKGGACFYFAEEGEEPFDLFFTDGSTITTVLEQVTRY